MRISFPQWNQVDLTELYKFVSQFFGKCNSRLFVCWTLVYRSFSSAQACVRVVTVAAMLLVENSFSEKQLAYDMEFAHNTDGYICDGCDIDSNWICCRIAS